MTDDPQPGEVPETEQELFMQVLNDERCWNLLQNSSVDGGASGATIAKLKYCTEQNQRYDAGEIAGTYYKHRSFQKSTATTEGRNVPKSNIS